MNNLYTDSALTAGYLHLMELSRAASQSPGQREMENSAFETYFESLINAVYSSLQLISPQSLPEVHLHTWQEGLDTVARLDAESIFTDQRGVHAGLSLVSKLDAAILVLSAYLMENYLWQVSPLTVETPPAGAASSPYDTLKPLSLYTARLPSIAEVVGLANFPAEALSLYSAHLIPEAEARDGYEKRPFQLIMECLQDARLTSGRTDDNLRALTRSVPKPLLDLVDFYDRFDSGAAVQAYQDPDKGPYLLGLHLQLLLDGLYLVIAHEVAHYQLGRLQHRGVAVAELRQDEAAADARGRGG